MGAAGRFGAVALVDGRIGTEAMPGVFAEVGMDTATSMGAPARAVRGSSDKNHAHSTLNPLATYTKR